MYFFHFPLCLQRKNSAVLNAQVVLQVVLVVLIHTFLFTIVDIIFTIVYHKEVDSYQLIQNIMHIKYHKNWNIWTALVRTNLSFHSAKTLPELLSKILNSLTK